MAYQSIQDYITHCDTLMMEQDIRKENKRKFHELEALEQLEESGIIYQEGARKARARLAALRNWLADVERQLDIARLARKAVTYMYETDAEYRGLVDEGQWEYEFANR